MKNILVTGGSGGIGREIVEHFSLLGYRVIFFYNNNELNAKILQQNFSAIPYKVNIVCEQDVSLAIRDIKSKFGIISAVINCAGVTKRALMQDCSSSDFDNIFGVNVKGIFNVCKNLAWDLIEAKGDIINISSIWATRPASCEVLYSASKGAVESFTRSLAEELAFGGVKVNAISPGFVNTAINNGLSQEDINNFLEDNFLKRVVTAKEIAEKCQEIISANETGKIYELFGE